MRRAVLATVIVGVAAALGPVTTAQLPDAATVHVPTELLAKVKTSQSVRVLVKLKLPFRAEGRLSNVFAVVAQRAGIGDAQQALLQTLALRRVDSVHRFKTIPYVAMEIDGLDLDMLRASQYVAEIHADERFQPALADSAGLIGATAVAAQGLTGRGWNVAILDDGVDAAHPFVAGRLVAEACFSTSLGSGTSLCPSGVASSTAPGSGTFCPDGACEHGTHVAGIAVGRGASFNGVAPEAGLISIQVFSDDAGSRVAFASDVIRGLEHVRSLADVHRIAAVNLSLGTGAFTDPCDDHPIKAAIDNLRSVGIATIAASGNSGYVNAINAPACISSAISVGSVGDGNGAAVDVLSAFSNTAHFIKLLAPGQLITSAVPGGWFRDMQGTSMAAPHVAGAWAVLKQAAPAASVDTILAALTSTGRPVADPWNGGTKPRIQVDEALAPLGGCRYAASPLQVEASAAGGSDSVRVATFPRNCTWTAASQVPWITLLANGIRTGDDLLAFSIAQNASGQQRTGTLIIAGLPITVRQAPAPGGLTATYYDNMDFSGTTLARVDSTIDFDWGGSSPAATIEPDTFSIRWTGQLEVPATDTYRFSTISDDGVRLWIDGRLLIDNWTNHAVTADHATVSLAAGRYPIRLDFFENGGEATVKLLWSSPAIAQQIVPAMRLFPPGATPPPPDGTVLSVPGIIQAEQFDDGDQGVAYHDTTAANEGGLYRSTGVDIETAFDVGGGYNIGWMTAGEWMAYTVDVATSGIFNIGARVAAHGAGGTFHLEANGVDITGPLTIPNTGGWQNWTTVVRTGVTLSAGRQRLRLVLDQNGAGDIFGNVNYLSIQHATAPPATAAADIVIYASDVPASALHGSWAFGADALSPNGVKLTTPDAGFARLDVPQAAPEHYLDIPFSAPGGVPYTVWLRIKAQHNSKWNDAVWVQFSDAGAGGVPVYPINTEAGLLVNLASDSAAADLDGWGWRNGAYWLNQITTVSFSRDGEHTVRIQVREDGVEIDQVILSPSTYRERAPGPVQGDATVVSKP